MKNLELAWMLQLQSREPTNTRFENTPLIVDGVMYMVQPPTYLTFDEGLPGPVPGYHYGHHFLFQGHENGSPRAYLTRINLDVTDPAHRITLLTPADASGNTGFGSIDGSSWDPFTKTMLFTEERGGSPSLGRVIEIDPTVWPSSPSTLECVLAEAAGKASIRTMTATSC